MNRTDWTASQSLARMILSRQSAIAMIVSCSLISNSVMAADEGAAATTEATATVVNSDTEVEPKANETESSNSAAVEHSHSLAMTAIHNQYRVQSGLEAQTADPYLSQVAQRWAEHMAYVGSMYHGGGEQIIAYSGGDRSYDAGFRLWRGSSPHHAWLCSRGNRCGFGYAVGRNGCAYYAGAFGGSYSESSVNSATNANNVNTVANYSTSSSYRSSGRFRLFRRRG